MERLAGTGERRAARINRARGRSGYDGRRDAPNRISDAQNGWTAPDGWHEVAPRGHRPRDEAGEPVAHPDRVQCPTQPAPTHNAAAGRCFSSGECSRYFVDRHRLRGLDDARGSDGCRAAEEAEHHEQCDDDPYDRSTGDDPASERIERAIRPTGALVATSVSGVGVHGRSTEDDTSDKPPEMEQMSR